MMLQLVSLASLPSIFVARPEARRATGLAI